LCLFALAFSFIQENPKSNEDETWIFKTIYNQVFVKEFFQLFWMLG
jgi:hypothetical protein